MEPLKLSALEARQGPAGMRVYAALVDARDISKFATVSHVRRDSDNILRGYQRQRVQSHIAEIRAYLESERPMIPNAICIAFDERVEFKPLDRDGSEGYGHLIVPIGDPTKGFEKPGLIVDGQQRCAAIEEARIDRFEIFIIAFKAADPQEQREQFIRVNSTKPLPRSLLHELLPGTTTKLNRSLQRKRLPAKLLEQLNYADGPFKGLIQTSTNPKGIVKDTSVLNMLAASLQNGILYYLRGEDDDEGIPRMVDLLNNYWTAVSEVFPDAWNLPPRRSRLMHGVGIMSMGALMDQIGTAYYLALGEEVLSLETFRENLEPLKEICHWTAGSGPWRFAPHSERKWNDLQNTGKDIRLLTDYLRVQYNTLVWDRKRASLAPA